MANAERSPVTLVVDGVEVKAAEGAMLVDAAKHGDVEIPVFCYEPKLGEPVGACRMCLVEVEGIPKLQTACSTPVRDGMVVYTQTDRVIEAQNAVVEFLLVNHPLDCPVCDKGGECPLQDIAMGWGPGRSRFTDPKRHFQKPLPLSPLVRIDRERCILCYRCVRFSQEVAEDEQLQFLERGDRTYVGTFDDRPYIAPFHGNIIELCPVGALTSETYRFRARPWDIEAAGSVCTLCPSQCNVSFTVRDEQVKRVLARDNHVVDDGWLCDKGRFGYQMFGAAERITEPMVRRGGELAAASWEEAIEAAADGLRTATRRAAALLGGGTSNEEGYLVQRVLRGALASADIDSQRHGKVPLATLRALARPAVAAATSDLDRADAILVLGCDPMHDSPILDLRIRKVVRRNSARLLVASERPTGLDGGAAESVRYLPGDGSAFISALAEAARGSLTPEGGSAYAHAADRIASELGPQSRTVVVWGSRLLRTDAAATAAALGELAGALSLADVEGSGLLEVPEEANGRGLRESGCAPTAGPGYAETKDGRGAPEIRDALAAGEVSALILANCDPVRDHPDGPGWTIALQAADFVLAVSMFENASTKHADVVLPAETHAEKEGTVTHPDGRLQRVRPNVPHPGEVRPGWQVLVELSAALGHELGLNTQAEVLAALVSEASIYSNLSNEEIGGRGVRWQERDTAASFGEAAPASATTPRNRAAGANGALRIGTYRDLWVSEATEHSPALRFLGPEQALELSPADAEKLGLADGQNVVVSSNGTSVTARLRIRERVRPGAGFLIEGVAGANANVLPVAGTFDVERAE